MRAKRTYQMSIYEVFSDHEVGRQFKAMSDWLDRHTEVLDWIEVDLRREGVKATGRAGMSVESVLRCGVLKQYWTWTYEELSFYLSDSVTSAAFARLPLGFTPTDSALQAAIGRIQSETWRRINQRLVEDALAHKVESARMVRIDSTVTATPIHAPWDSALLGDAVRIMNRLLDEAQQRAPEVRYTRHQRVVKKLVTAIRNDRGADKRREHYKKLIKHTRRTLERVKNVLTSYPQWGDWDAKARHYIPLIERVISQSERRAVKGEDVAAHEKVVSLFEEHTDIIVKDKRQTQYGHKLKLTTGKHGMLLDVVIESDNPADSTRLLPMIERIETTYGTLPRQVAADAGYASKANINEAKARGVKAVGLPQKRGMTVKEMTGSEWVYKKLKRFRAGIEGNISMLKRVFGLDRCTWRGLEHFKAYVMSAALAYNLQLFARLTL